MRGWVSNVECEVRQESLKMERDIGIDLLSILWLQHCAGHTPDGLWIWIPSALEVRLADPGEDVR